MSEDISKRIGRAWTRIRRPIAGSAIRDYLFGTGDDALEAGQMDALEVLADGQPWRMSDLATALGVEPSTATRTVQRLVNSGLAERASTTNDGRVVNVVITALGDERQRVVRARRDRLMAHMLGAFDPAEWEALADHFDRFVAAMEAFANDVTPLGESAAS